MEKNQSNDPSNGYAMASGDGPSSYTKNSSYQRGVVDTAKLLIQEAVEKKLTINNISDHNNTFSIADLGCSTGPNTFFAVQNILEAVELKYKNHGSNTSVPEFHVYFNDYVSNDFNTLFRSLPIDRKYYVSGVPGSFYTRLFPCASLDFVHSSYSLHWLSKLPEEILDRDSAAWNKGRIHYAKAEKEVVEAYANEHAREMDSFLQARAREVVPGGLMAITVAGRPDGVLHSKVNLNIMFEALGSSLMDLAKMGKIDEDKVNSCNLPIYLASPQELETIIKKNGSFTIEGMETLPPAVKIVDIPSTIVHVSAHMRAITEALITENFGDEILDELFELFLNKLREASIFPLGKELNLFVLLKRKLEDE